MRLFFLLSYKQTLIILKNKVVKYNRATDLVREFYELTWINLKSHHLNIFRN